MSLDTFNLSAFLPYRLAVLSERVSRRLSSEYGKSHGLSVGEWRVLVHLLRSKEVSVREIHDCVNLEKPRVSRAVSRLEAAGLVRKVPGADDARLVAISLTDQGLDALSEILPGAMTIEARLLDALSPCRDREFRHRNGEAPRRHGRRSRRQAAVPSGRPERRRVSELRAPPPRRSRAAPDLPPGGRLSDSCQSLDIVFLVANLLRPVIAKTPSRSVAALSRIHGHQLGTIASSTLPTSRIRAGHVPRRDVAERDRRTQRDARRPDSSRP